jgi:hypothetical protein
MSNKTSVEWFLDQLTHRKELYDSEGYSIAEEMAKLKHEARQMHRQEIVDAHFEGQCDNTEGYPLQIAEEYYNETYGGQDV